MESCSQGVNLSRVGHSGVRARDQIRICKTFISFEPGVQDKFLGIIALHTVPLGLN